MNLDFENISDIEVPLVSVIITAFNRAHTIVRAINSVLNQSYKKTEVIVVDDGSTDNTKEILNTYNDPRIRVHKHETNKGVTAAKNSGLNQIKGQWFTILDSDDEMKPQAIETMIRIPLLIDPTITAVSCNCWDLETKSFTGKGLTKDQYVDVTTLMITQKGILWGITKTNLLQDDRFNENLNGFESTLWYKIDDRAKRYYIHSALLVLHTEGNDRITKSKRKYNFKREINTYQNIIKESYYLETIKKYRPSEYQKICRSGLITMKIIGNQSLASTYYELLRSSKKSFVDHLIYKFRFISLLVNQFGKFKFFLRTVYES